MQARLPRGSYNTSRTGNTNIENMINALDRYIYSTLSKYGVKSIQELEEKIKNGEIPDHPAWEDLIVLENLIAYRQELKRAIRNIGT